MPRLQSRYNRKFENCTDAFNTRMISWHQPGNINFGTMMELEAVVDISGYTDTTSPKLLIKSQVVRFRMPVISKEKYDIWYSKFNSLNGRIVNKQDEIQNKMVLIEDEGRLSVVLGTQRGM
jgi:hypothetical protein